MLYNTKKLYSECDIMIDHEVFFLWFDFLQILLLGHYAFNYLSLNWSNLR